MSEKVKKRIKRWWLLLKTITFKETVRKTSCRKITIYRYLEKIDKKMKNEKVFVV